MLWYDKIKIINIAGNDAKEGYLGYN